MTKTPRAIVQQPHKVITSGYFYLHARTPRAIAWLYHKTPHAIARPYGKTPSFICTAAPGQSIFLLPPLLTQDSPCGNTKIFLFKLNVFFRF